ncbi:acylphosphatase [Archaeoglobus veneficus]|uniref:acylphosphatase n=1 Tax=Archaeoglobus veneficus (strain DSM 11195 / SNP6) TaxID=693661 RepID=F2KQ02_ARCVS|nr:acylphosphatase [Archaeoglobus veneficus]AEA46509.1 acylphosphatase [Archaeoglobus veneficus SNP6]
MKIKIIIKGKVHGVGYRVKLINMALEYGIDRFGVFNVEIDGKQAVMVLVDASDEIVEIVKQRIEKEKPEKAVVESISFEEYRYEVPPIERSIQTFQIEHWGKAIPVLLEIRDSIREEGDKTRKELGAKIDSVGKKVDKVGEKVDSVGDRVDRVGEKVDLLRSDLKEYMESNLRRIQEEIAEIKGALKKAGIM